MTKYATPIHNDGSKHNNRIPLLQCYSIHPSQHSKQHGCSPAGCNLTILSVYLHHGPAVLIIHASCGFSNLVASAKAAAHRATAALGQENPMSVNHVSDSHTSNLWAPLYPPCFLHPPPPSFLSLAVHVEINPSGALSARHFPPPAHHTFWRGGVQIDSSWIIHCIYIDILYMCPYTRDEFLTTGMMDVDADVGC